MKKWLLFILLAIPSVCFGQGVRVDNIAIRGAVNPLQSIANAQITVCTSAGTGLPCAPLATTYTDATLGTPCSSAKQVVLANTSTCVATADSIGNYGFWVAPGKYVVTITAVGIPGYSTVVTLQCPLDGNCAITGNNTHSGTETFNGPTQFNTSQSIKYGIIDFLTSDAFAQLRDGGQSYFLQAGPRSNEFVVTGVSISGNVLTLTGTTIGVFSAPEIVYLENFFNEPFLDETTVTLTSASPTQLQANFTHANYSNLSTTGFATFPFLHAAVTLTLPDLTNLGGVATQGYGLGVTAADDALMPGHCVGYSGGGLSVDSHIGCNSNITFPTATANGPIWPNGANSTELTAVNPTGNRNPRLPDASGVLALTGTLTPKKGSGAGNYTTASTTFVVVDATNLCYTVTIPVGWKLGVTASGNLGTSTAVVAAAVALTDNAACSTANAGLLTQQPVFGNAAGNTEPFSLNWVIAGDGAAHNVALQFLTSNGADSALMINASATQLPTMTFQLEPSN